VVISWKEENSVHGTPSAAHQCEPCGTNHERPTPHGARRDELIRLPRFSSAMVPSKSQTTAQRSCIVMVSLASAPQAKLLAESRGPAHSCPLIPKCWRRR